MDETRADTGRKKQTWPVWLRLIVAYATGIVLIGPCVIIAIMLVDPLVTVVQLGFVAVANEWADPRSLGGTAGWVATGIPGFAAFLAIGLVVAAVARHKGALHSIIYGVVVGLAGLWDPQANPMAGYASSDLAIARTVLIVAAFAGSCAGGLLWVLLARMRRHA